MEQGISYFSLTKIRAHLVECYSGYVARRPCHIHSGVSTNESVAGDHQGSSTVDAAGGGLRDTGDSLASHSHSCGGSPLPVHIHFDIVIANGKTPRRAGYGSIGNRARHCACLITEENTDYGIVRSKSSPSDRE